MQELRNFENYQTGKGMSIHTVKNATAIIEEFLKILNVSDIEEFRNIKKSDFDTYTAELRNIGNGGSTINKKLSHVSRFYTYLYNDDIIVNHVPNKYGKVNETKRTESVLVELTPTDEEFEMLLEAVENRPKYYAIFTILGYAGLRISELCNLKLKDVRENSIFVKGKGDKERHVYLSKSIMNVIINYITKYRKDGEFNENYIRLFENKESYLAKIDESKDYVFLTKTGIQMDATNVYSSIQKCGLKLNIEKDKLHPHAFRRFYAFTFVKSGGDLDVLKNQMGHGDMNTSKRYYFTAKERIMKDVNKMGETYKGELN